ncbi:MAG: proline dehydrogenase family protein [Chloroflexi bacterium]|nr:proline dehydrogenase family protein [Chloroflexota bacterium]
MTDFNLIKRTWQRSMIWLACRDNLRERIEGSDRLAALAKRFVAGSDVTAARHKAEELAAARIHTSVYFLGEYVDSAELVEENVKGILAAIEQFGQTNLDWFMSVDPTQIGCSISDELGWANAQRIGEVIKTIPNAQAHPMMIDMEDARVVPQTIALFEKLLAAGVPAAITLQTYLFRTSEDFQRLAGQGATIRLVKGAFVASRRIAYTHKRDIDDAYLRLCLLALSPAMKAAGHRPIFATHDDRILDILLPVAQANGWSPNEYEIEMLLGVREPYQRDLAAAGHMVRVYVPFGSAWWPYSIRRVGENPANGRFVLRAMLRR